MDELSDKSVLIISFTPVKSEPRVLRQVRAFLDHGAQVTVAGYPPSLSDTTENLDFVPIGAGTEAVTPHFEPQPQAQPQPQPKKPDNRPLWKKRLSRLLAYTRRMLSYVRRMLSYVRRMLTYALRKIYYPVYRLLPYCLGYFSHYSPQLALSIYWKNSIYAQTYATLAKLEKKDLIVAHDWFTAPIAEKLATDWGVPFVVDIHEYARRQNELPSLKAKLRYYLLWLPSVKAVHRLVYPRAKGLSCVCDGIAELVWKEEKLPYRPVTVRSTSFYEESPFRPCEGKVTVLYHGLFTGKRKLDVLVRAIPLCQDRFHFVLRGHGEDKEMLQALASQLGVEHRITIENSVPFHDIVSAANRADIGYIVLDDFSPQHKFVLPNKFFEYTMAGLALLVNDFPEMAKIVGQYANGKFVPTCTAQAIADGLNRFTLAEINTMKQRSLEAAKDLCWEKEQYKMFEAYGIPLKQPAE